MKMIPHVVHIERGRITGTKVHLENKRMELSLESVEYPGNMETYTCAELTFIVLFVHKVAQVPFILVERVAEPSSAVTCLCNQVAFSSLVGLAVFWLPKGG